MPKRKKEPLPRADLAVYRDSNGAACIAPGTLIASRRNQKIYVLNCTTEHVEIDIPRKLSLKLGRAPSKIEVDISGIPTGCHMYQVKVGNDFAKGNSSPTLIIDD